MCIRDSDIVAGSGYRVDETLQVLCLGQKVLGIIVLVAIILVKGNVAVSYTHLDVYKRQPLSLERGLKQILILACVIAMDVDIFEMCIRDRREGREGHLLYGGLYI